MIFKLKNPTVEKQPFPHFFIDELLPLELAETAYNWLSHTKNWSLTEAEFYSQYEFDVMSSVLPDNVKSLVNPEVLENLSNELARIFSKKNIELVTITAHKFIHGHNVGIHNDFIDDEETHRLVIHLNPYWVKDNGGYLMIFNSSNPEHVSNVFEPVNNTAFGFEISNKSYHAVSTIHDSVRYSLVYTFRCG
ncbi:MAG: 2OG-Fe(II) oxygenase [Bacteroidetes bacterium]|nr:2OG-Fe(II) oxygenase [Bacteroidota bacterium]